MSAGGVRHDDGATAMLTTDFDPSGFTRRNKSWLSHSPLDDFDFHACTVIVLLLATRWRLRAENFYISQSGGHFWRDGLQREERTDRRMFNTRK